MALPLAFRAVDRAEDGTEFVDYLYERATAVADTPTQARSLAQRAWIFLQQYDHMRDRMHADGDACEPTVEQYAERWRMPIRTAHRAFAEFDSLFPGEADAGRVCRELWDGIGRQAPPRRLMALAAVKVVAT